MVIVVSDFWNIDFNNSNAAIDANKKCGLGRGGGNKESLDAAKPELANWIPLNNHYRQKCPSLFNLIQYHQK